MNNGSMVHQLRMALETYQTKLQEKQNEHQKRDSKDMPDFSDRINIS
jgi:hypothetical protein